MVRAKRRRERGFLPLKRADRHGVVMQEPNVCERVNQVTVDFFFVSDIEWQPQRLCVTVSLLFFTFKVHLLFAEMLEVTFTCTSTSLWLSLHVFSFHLMQVSAQSLFFFVVITLCLRFSPRL